MKKLTLTIMAVLFGAAIVSAQDLNTVTDTYNNGATALSMGALFSIKQDICGFEFETRFTLSTIEVND